MGLTFQQKFYQVPDVYVVLYTRPDIPKKVAAILPMDISQDTLNKILKTGFEIEEMKFDELIRSGTKLMELVLDD